MPPRPSTVPLPLSPEPDAAALALMPRRSRMDYPRRVDLTLGDAARVVRLIDAVPDAQGRPFLTLSAAVALALDIAANVIAAGELGRYRTPPPEPLPMPELSAAALAWLEGFRADVEAKAAKDAEAARKRDRSSGKRRR